LSSPSERTQGTLDLVIADNTNIKTEFHESIYQAEVSSIIRLLRAQDDSDKNILVLGHNPGLHLLTEHLTKTDIKKFPTCSFVKLSNFDSWKDLDANILNLEFFVTPKDLFND